MQTQVYEDSAWRTVSYYDLAQQFPDPPAGTNGEKKLWLDSITQRPGGEFNWSAFDQIEAEYFDDESGTAIKDGTDAEQGHFIGQTDDGDWLKFADIDFGAGADKVLLRIATTLNQGDINIRLDQVTATAIATFAITSTGGWQTWDTREQSISGVSGVHDVYVTFDGSGLGVILNWLRFNPSSALPGLPAVNYDYEMLKNRRSDVATYPMYMPRLDEISTELGGEIFFTYGQSHACPSSLGSYVRIPYDCFPDWVGGSPDLWNKWKVVNLSTSDSFSGNATETYTYTYSTPTWGYNDEIYNAAGYFWNEYRGSKIVTATVASGAQTEYRFYRGMEGDYESSHHENITLSNSTTRTDYNWLRGQVAEVRRLEADIRVGVDPRQRA